MNRVNACSPSFFLFMVYLSVGLTQRDLAYRFDIHQSTVSLIITTWANFLYTVLGSVCIWMSEEAVKAHMPKEFHYPDTSGDRLHRAAVPNSIFSPASK